jgi:hypothetical protein
MLHHFAGDGLDLFEVGGVVVIFDLLLFALHETVEVGTVAIDVGQIH